MTELKCLRCGHEWISRKDTVKACVKCKSYNWNIPKKHKEVITQEEVNIN